MFESHVRDVRAERHLVIAEHKAEIVAGLQRRGSIGGRARRGTPDRKIRRGQRQTGELRQITVDVDSHRLRPEKRRSRPRNRRPVHRGPEVVHNRAADQVGFAHREGLIEIVEPRRRGRQQIVADVVGRRFAVLRAQVAREQRVILAQRVIHFTDSEVLVVLGRQPVRRLAALLILRHRKLCGNGQRNRRKLRHRDHVIHERLKLRRGQRILQRNRRRLARLRRHHAEVPRLFLRRRNIGDGRIGALPRIGLLVAREKKQRVLPHRPAQNPSKLIPLQRIRRGRKRLPRIQMEIAEKFKRVSVPFVSARFGHGIHRRGRMHPVLRLQAPPFPP